MPKIERWNNLPPNVRQHLIDRMRDRTRKLAARFSPSPVVEYWLDI